MTMFSMKPKFNLAEFLAESAPKKKRGSKALPRTKSSKASISLGTKRSSRQETGLQD